MREPMVDRRQVTSMLMATAALSAAPAVARAGRRRHILLRSGWQVENIGDVAHTPAVLALLERYIPDAQVTFWPFYDYCPSTKWRC